ncbi:5'-adenylylsulfate reductase-like 4 [Sesamum alatum]|uniref:5'-adenylylsulfate reductase-like 4 n=1 Tax=Sesamum alatum TaxID=300844 RepID=A0AAE1YPE7_9LAMI|nr:5'-adenylylsulfate reductase-like 4 [Sesamum alatum]
MAVVHGAGLVLFLFLGGLTCAYPVRVPLICPAKSVKDFIFASQDDMCSVGEAEFAYTTGVTEGNEITLQKALNIIHKNEHAYVALLFYSSWCPFSWPFRPSFSMLSSIFPSVPHFSIEESAVRPSILSKYGVHGFPTLILLNSTMRMRYQGSRTLDSLISFYGEFTGIKPLTDGVSFDKTGCSGYAENHENYQESCPFPWARSPENLFQQETYLALATIFVILRLLHFAFPTIRRCTRLAWRRYTINVSLSSLWEHPVVYLKQVIQLFNSLKEPCKRSNLQEGAKNAKAWASKSLATVSLGDASSSRDASVSCAH